MDTQGLPSTSEDILRLCPRFRILLVGKSGVGKSSLIKHIFSVASDSVSHRDHGICDIHTEITSPQNPRFVVHDSQGFEPGAVDNLNIVKTFLQERENAELKDRVHAVWLCIQVPFAGGRVFERGDEELVRLGLKTPIIVVFTQFDKLIAQQEQHLTDKDTKNKSEDEIDALVRQRANDAFKTSCVDQLAKLGRNLSYEKVSVNRGHQNSLSGLVNITQELVSRHVEGDVWIVSAMAQRASAQAKINSSIEVGMKKYWQGLASSASFSGSTFKACLSTIHIDITSSWNFNDPDDLLNGKEFQEKIMKLVQSVTPESLDVPSWFSQNIQAINNSVGVASSFASVIAPPIAAIGLSAMFLQWAASVYEATPEVLRCLMAYIIDLTLVLDQLFLDILPQKPPRRLSADLIDTALDSFKTLGAQSVHEQIRAYAQASTFAQILQSNNAQQKVVDIIRQRTGWAPNQSEMSPSLGDDADVSRTAESSTPKVTSNQAGSTRQSQPLQHAIGNSLEKDQNHHVAPIVPIPYQTPKSLPHLTNALRTAEPKGLGRDEELSKDSVPLHPDDTAQGKETPTLEPLKSLNDNEGPPKTITDTNTYHSSCQCCIVQ